MVETNFKTCGLNMAAFRALQGVYDHHNRHTVQGIEKILKTFEETGSVS